MERSVAEIRSTLSDLAQRIDTLGRYLDVDGLRRKLDGLNDRSQREGFWDDADKARAVMSERADVEQSLSTFDKLTADVRDQGELLEMAVAEDDQSVIADVAKTLDKIEKRMREAELARMLSGPQDRADAIVSISPGAGGIDAQDWAEMLMRMYLRWCEHKGFKTEMINLQPGDDAGVKDVSFTVHGAYAYGFLRAENGVHRLIRISPFDSNARRHTGFAAVLVVPDLGDAVDEVEIKPEDLKVDTYRSGGAGGQHINKTESAIRITHIPTGIVVACQSERSQHKNRSTAMKMLAGRLYEKARQEREAEFAQNYTSGQMAISFGSQVRSYTLQPYTLVKDERTEHKATNAQSVLDGDLDEFIEAYLLKAANEREAREKGKESN
ncbi:MAG TPA: peptide chain release factor 2 [Polyangiales bacterium]|nr:peptide chain release factor 2 [Polyangiales bacterium]